MCQLPKFEAPSAKVHRHKFPAIYSVDSPPPSSHWPFISFDPWFPFTAQQVAILGDTLRPHSAESVPNTLSPLELSHAFLTLYVLSLLRVFQKLFIFWNFVMLFAHFTLFQPPGCTL